jgi:rubrerythrin
MSLTNKKLDYYKKDEHMAVREYEEAAKQVATEAARDMFLSMSRDEARHAEMLNKIQKLEEEKKKPKKHRFGLFSKKEEKEPYEEKVKEYLEEVEPSTEVAGMEEYED